MIIAFTFCILQNVPKYPYVHWWHMYIVLCPNFAPLDDFFHVSTWNKRINTFYVSKTYVLMRRGLGTSHHPLKHGIVDATTRICGHTLFAVPETSGSWYTVLLISKTHLTYCKLVWNLHIEKNMWLRRDTIHIFSSNSAKVNVNNKKILILTSIKQTKFFLLLNL